MTHKVQRAHRLWETVTHNLYFKCIGTCAVLLGILVLAFWIRTQGVEHIPDGQFTSNDAYLYYWQAQTISEQGYLPSHDKHRWLPNGRDNRQLLSLYAYALAYTHKVVNLFFYKVSLYHVCLYAPIICFVNGLAILTIFLIKRYGLEFTTVVVLLLATLPGAVDRSIGGFSDRDAWCWMLAILTITVYLWKEQMQHGKWRWFVTAIAGTTVFLGGLSWEGFGFFLLVILSVELWKFCTTDAEVHLKEYILWVLMFAPWLYLISPAYQSGYGYSTHVGPLMLAPPMVLLVLKSIRYLLLRHIRPLRSHPRKLAAGLTLLSILTGGSYILLQYSTFETTAFPLRESRLMQIIEELADPDLSYWVGRYGAVFIFGSIGLITAALQQWKRSALTLGFGLLLLSSTIFLRHPITGWIGPSKAEFLFAVSIPLTAVGLCIAMIQRQTFGNQNRNELLMAVVWFILWGSLARGGKRYDFFIGVPLALGAAYLIQYITAALNVNKELVKFRGHPLPPKLVTVGFTALILIVLMFWEPVGGHATRTLKVSTKQQLYPGNQNTMRAFEWIKTQLPPDKTLMAAHWEYGTQLNVHANVKTITDPDHYYPYWVYLYYRHVYCAQSETEALYFLRTHEATHLMITSADIISAAGKSSFVGSNLFFDRYFNLHPLLYLPTAPGTQYSLAPESRTLLGPFTPQTALTAVEIKGASIENLTVTARFNAEETVHIPYIAFQGATRIRSSQPTTNDAKGGLLLLFDTKRILRNAFYVPEIGWNSLAFKLFVRGEHSDAFENIYTIKSEDRATPPDVQIWKINYPENIKPHPKYIATQE